MKRLVLSICLAGSLAAISASAASGFASNFDYVGHVKGDPNASVGFFAQRTGTGQRKVAGFTVSQVPYTCSDAPSDTTAGWQFEPKMRVRSDRTFSKTGDWKGLPLDPVGRVSGKLHKGGVAVGEFKLRGELAGPGTHCTTGLLDWRATKQPQQEQPK
jgi:hypothetical protein